MRKTFATLCSLALLALAGCQQAAPPAEATVDPYTPRPFVQVEPPSWSRDATLYQVNIRQFTPEGTLAAAQRELPRLKALGVRVLWLMPIHPIGEKNRKGTLGSPYSVTDYKGVNPEFGTTADFKSFVDAAHAEGLYVILDWVANHTAWDHPWVQSHPEWYARDYKGDFHPTSFFDWSDIIDLDYSQTAMRREMAEAMKYWVRDLGVDGFRCDTAAMVPLDFWNAVRAELEAIKPVFMLAEAETRDVHQRAFDASYAWSLYNALRGATSGSGAGPLVDYFSQDDNTWPAEAMRMNFTSNHDHNSWHATEFKAFGDALPATMALTFTARGIPLIYNGQEAGNPKMLLFFERDPIQWREHPNGAFLKRLVQLKKDTPALHNGAWGGTMLHVPNSEPGKVFSFVRQVEGSKLLGVFNFSAKPVTVTLKETLFPGRYTDFASGQQVTLAEGQPLTLPAWGYHVLTAR
ncbi:MAG: hypothetical protein RL026_1188 [Pseudomonadota bacterium]